MASVAQKAAAEFTGTAFLLAAVVGSGIMAQRLAGGNAALALLCNTLATGAILPVIILMFGGVSGAHFNPAGRSLRRGPLHHVGILVHRLDVICKSRGDDCAFALGHLCGHRACRDCRIHVGPVCRDALRDCVCTLALGARCACTSRAKTTSAIASGSL
jgi:hypothetical protein